ncbi:MAG: CidA/LrgA family protein [Beijerinckiaceae bacterium]
MIVSLAAILLCQLAGEALARGLNLPAPGPVIGMALMIGVLAMRQRFSAVLPDDINNGGVERVSKTMLAHLSLLFVPAGVGVVQNLDLFARHGFALFVALLVSTFLTLIVTVAVFRATARLMGDAEARR